MFKKSFTLAKKTRIYAIGDVHGYADSLKLLQQKIDDDIRARPIDTVKIVYLGDYIDRGPDSKGVISFLVERELVAPHIEFIFLLGNHEDAMMSYLYQHDEAYEEHADWLLYGGVEALESYGVQPNMALTHRDRVKQISDDLQQQMPLSHQEFLKNLKLYHEEKGFLFVHGAIKPGVKLENQTKHDLTFKRQPFMRDTRLHPWRVVHGHTATRDFKPEILPNRINLDTGHYMGGPLTAAVIEGGQVDIMDIPHPKKTA